eukprot:symbB.v1.2.009230.t1/scaffold583.1/size184467/2
MTIGDSGDGYSGAAGNGTRLAVEQNVIVVSLNYRLGPLGFLPFRQLGAANGTGGMNGLYDQIVALQWIQANIQAFGGDPHRAYAPAMRKHWRPRNSTGGIFGVNRLLPTDVGAEVLRAYNWKTFTEVGGPAAAFKAADGDYHVLCPLRRFALEAVSQALVMTAETGTSSASLKCQRPLVRPDPAESCSWRFGFSHRSKKYECRPLGRKLPLDYTHVRQIAPPWAMHENVKQRTPRPVVVSLQEGSELSVVKGRIRLDPYPPDPTTVTSFDVNVAGIANAADPPCLDSNGDGTGQATNGPFAHGDTCEPKCQDGYTRSRTLLTCTTQSDSDYQSDTGQKALVLSFSCRQECSNTDLNGDWQTSEEITTTTLTPPVTIFTLPNSDVYDSPGSVMVAFDQAVVPGMDNRTVELIKFGDNCLPSDDGTYNYTKMASEMKTTSLEGSRILIITPPEAYWAGSCTYNELDEPMSFTIDDLYPNVEYFVVCSGWIPGKFWVPTVEIAATWATTQTVTTLEDTETGISNFQLTVYAECKDGTFHQIYTAAMLTSAFELGYTAQIDQWIEACQPGVSLELSESVNFTYEGTVHHLPSLANLATRQVLATVVDIGFSWPAFEGTTTPYQMVSSWDQITNWLPFILKWQTAIFVIPLWISFSPPVMSVTALTATLTAQTDIQVPGDQAAGLSNIISYAQPLPASMTSDMASAVRESGESSILDLGMIVNTFPAYIYIFGSAFPSLDGLGLKGAAVAGYKAELVYTGCDAVELCQSITWMNDTHLRCLTTSCLDITCFPRLPNVKLYLGDLVGSTELERSINFPRPIIQRFSPGTLEEFVISTKVRNVRDQSNTVSTVPPALLSHPESLTWNLLGSVYLPLNGDTAGYGVDMMDMTLTNNFASANGVYASEIDPSTDTMWALTPLIFIVNLLTCDAGYRRESGSPLRRLNGPYDVYHVLLGVQGVGPVEMTTKLVVQQVSMVAMRVVVFSHTKVSLQWMTPQKSAVLRCSSCPEFTTSPQGSDAVTHCTCLPGYFSPYYDETTGKTTPGTPCTSCHNTDYMQDLSSDESCGDSGYNVNVATTTLDFRICKLYCPGGLDAYRPVIQRCLPTIACLPGNEYEDVACSLCKFGWFMDASTGLCTECGEAQKIGMIVMAIVSVIGSFGCLVFFAFFMRFNADIVFKRDLLVAFQRYVLAPLKKSNFFAKAKRKSEARKAITIHKSQLGMSHSFSKYRELGMVFRVDESQIVHLAGLTKDSPLRGKVLPGWKVNTINGRRVKVRKEAEVQEIIQASRFPLRLTFSAPLKSKDQVKQESDGKSADGVNFDDDRKMIVVLLGVLTSFTKVSGFDFEWPDAFTELETTAAL